MTSEKRKNDNSVQSGILYLVPTPIGNLEDVTQRALKVLSAVDIIASEDTRHSSSLLRNLNITYNKLESYHDYNEESKSKLLVEEIINGKSVALISDAGSPGISDPGYRIISEAVKNKIKIISLPGPTAFVPALIASGFRFDKFLFAGFPPHKKGRMTFLKELAGFPFTIVLYESPHRIEKLINEINEHFGSERSICLAREISKIYEDYQRGTAPELLLSIKSGMIIKGEYVVIIDSQK